MKMDINYFNKRESGFFRMIFKYILALCFLLNLSCEDFVEVDPPISGLTGETVFNSDEEANAALISVYARMMQSQFGFYTGERSVTFLMGRYTDELLNYSTTQEEIQFFETQVFPQNSRVESWWREFYTLTYTCNAVIDGVSNNSAISQGLSEQLEGEARFLRALHYFYLVNLFGGVPLVTSPDFSENQIIARSSIEEVYQLIIQDLIEAKNLLPEENGSSDRTRANKGAATSLLSRIYLYTGQWDMAEQTASEIIENPNYQLVSDLNSVFLRTSPEAIFRLTTPFPELGQNTWDGFRFVLTRAPTRVSTSLELVSAFESGDLRRENWLGEIIPDSETFYFPSKYKERFTPGAAAVEFLVVMRLAEQYLIRAEARAQLGNIAGAQSDLNIIRNRAGLPNTTANSQADVLNAILQERRIELFSEMGHRFFDLKRFQRLDETLNPIKPNWDATDALLPIPAVDIDRNPALDQNPGY